MPKMWQLPMFVVGVTLQVVSGARLDVVCPDTGGCKISIDGKVWSSTVDTMTRERGVVSYPIITRAIHNSSTSCTAWTDTVGRLSPLVVCWARRGTKRVAPRVSRAHGVVYVVPDDQQHTQGVATQCCKRGEEEHE